MKKVIVSLLAVIIVCSAAFFMYGIVTKLKKRKAETEKINQLSNFRFNSIDGSPITESVLSKQKYTLIVYFNSECEHCQYEIKEIIKNIDSFNNSQILLITTQPREEALKFSKQNMLDKHPVTVIAAEYTYFASVFGHCSVPNQFIYNNKGKLIQQFKGETKVEAILKYIQ